MALALRAFFCAAALSAVPRVPAGELAPTDVGVVKPFTFYASPGDTRDSKATPSNLKAIEATARTLVSLIAEVPALNPPRGFNGYFRGSLMGPDPLQARVRPVAPFGIQLMFGAPRMDLQEVTFLRFRINAVPPLILDHRGLRHWEDARGDLYLEPVAKRDVGGLPMYDDLLVVARPGDSLWAPVPVERFARVLAAEQKDGADAAEKARSQAKANLVAFLSPPEQQKRRAEIDAARRRGADAEVRSLEFFFARDEAEIRKKVDPDPSQPKDEQWYFGPVRAYQETQSLLAGLDAAGRSAPACVIGGETVERWRMRIVPAGTPGCHAVVESNLGLFKPELPRSAIQLITVENIDYCRRDVAEQKKKTVDDCAANLEVVRQLDWRRVAALLEQ